MKMRRLMKEKWVSGTLLATLTKWDGPDQEIIKQDTVGTYEEAFRMLEDYILDCGDADEYVLEQFEDYAMKRDIKGRKQRISALERCGKTSEEFLTAGYGIVLTVDEVEDDWNTYPDEYAESRKIRFIRIS